MDRVVHQILWRSMSMQAQPDLLSLPVGVLCNVLCNTLSLEELVRLDSAFCCQNRDIWLQLVSSKPFTFHAPVDLSDPYEVQWLLKRNVKVSNIEFSFVLVEVGVQLISKYLRMHGSFVRSVDFVGGDKTHEMNLAAINCRNLTRVSASCATLTNAFTSVLHYNPNIQELVWGEVESKESHLFEGLALHKLHTFRVDGFDCNDTKGSLWHKTAHSNSLHAVIWEDCAFENEDWEALIANCPGLKSFAWNYAGEGDYEGGFTAEISYFPARLVNLSCFHNFSFTDAAILTVSKNLTSLRTLNIQECIHLTDLTLLHLADYSGNTLEVLYVDIHNPESKETGQILQIFSQQCTKLRYLNINCGEKMLCAGRGTSLLVRGCPALCTLVVNKQDTICESSREFIADRRPNLKLLVHDSTTKYDILSMPI